MLLSLASLRKTPRSCYHPLLMLAHKSVLGEHRKVNIQFNCYYSIINRAIPHDLLVIFLREPNGNTCPTVTIRA